MGPQWHFKEHLKAGTLPACTAEGPGGDGGIPCSLGQAKWKQIFREWTGSLGGHHLIPVTSLSTPPTPAEKGWFDKTGRTIVSWAVLDF